MRWFATGYCVCYTPHNLVTRSFKPFVNGAGLPEVRFHDLRHTYATTFTPCGGTHPKVVQELLGHTSVTTTIQNYKTLSPAVSRSAKGERHADTTVG